uniref:Barrier-to-autointegration factor n=1 Tax=Anas platyrhynchos platyrhynchos TaxID=8840 RepID=A0A493TQX7_ANAPP
GTTSQKRTLGRYRVRVFRVTLGSLLGHFRSFMGPLAYVVLGQFLVLKKDEELFREWLRDACGANAKQSRDCSGCLREWCDAFL